MINEVYENYDELNNTDDYVINIFYLEKCKPMKKYLEILKNIGFENVYLYSLDKNPLFINRFGIEGSPSTLIYHQNKMVKQFMGVPKETYLKEIKKNMFMGEEPNQK